MNDQTSEQPGPPPVRWETRRIRFQQAQTITGADKFDIVMDIIDVNSGEILGRFAAGDYLWNQLSINLNILLPTFMNKSGVEISVAFGESRIMPGKTAVYGLMSKRELDQNRDFALIPNMKEVPIISDSCSDLI